MKTILSITILSCLVAVVHAGIPKKAPLFQYNGLWTNSPFTSKPPTKDPVQPVNPLDDFTLTGIAPVPGGYMITIMNKKDPTEKVVISPGVDSKFKVISVNRNPEERLGTTVVLSAGSVQGTVSFEPDLITIKAPAAAAPPQANNPTLPPGVTPAQAAGVQTPQRPPRPRIMPPPTTGNTPQPSQNRGNAADRRTERRR